MKQNDYMKKFLPFFLLFLGSISLSFGQQDKMFTQYLNYPSGINPAYSGSRDALQLLGISRKQWVGIEGAPESTVLSANSPINFFNLGLGLTLATDKLGPEKMTDVGIDVSYKIQLTDKTFLNFGIKTGFMSYKLDIVNTRVVDYNDQMIQANLEDSWSPHFGVGAYLYGEKYFVGFSIPHLLQTKLSGGEFESSLDRNKLHYYLTGGYLMQLSPVVKLKPSVFIKATQGSRISYDLTGMVILYDRIWLGSSYRKEDAIAAIVQYNFTSQLKLGYSYDIGIAKLSGRGNGSHEISVSYDLSLTNRKIKSPRYF